MYSTRLDRGSGCCLLVAGRRGRSRETRLSRWRVVVGGASRRFLGFGLFGPRLAESGVGFGLMYPHQGS